jgi:serine phosphatase RsbU (regulator of sigma subunit)
MVICRSLKTKIITGNSYEIVAPSEVLAHLNYEMILRQGRTTRFATAVYAVINCRNRTMTLAGAGHPPPFLLAPGGEPRLLETTGGLLGVFDDETYDQIEVDLSVNDRLVLYSDGFEQAFPREDVDDYARKLPTTRYRDEFRQLARERSPDAMIYAMGRRIDDQQGSLHQVDDLTLICMVAGPITDDENAPVEPGHAHNAPPVPIG